MMEIPKNTPGFSQKVTKESLYDLLISFEQEVKKLLEEKGKLQEEKDQLLQENNRLKQELFLMRHKIFGKKSEKQKTLKDDLKKDVQEDDPQIFDEAQIKDVIQEDEEEGTIPDTLKDLLNVKESTDSDKDAGQQKKKKTGRKPLPDYLPREIIIHDLTDNEKICGCGCALKKIGEEISEQLDVIPAQVKVLQHVRYKYACKTCEEGVKIAPRPAQPIAKGLATAGLLAHVCISKYDDHLPLYRQSEIWQRMSVDLPRSTLSSWIIKVGVLVYPIVVLLQETIVKSSYVQADETTTQVLHEPGRAPTATSYMWLYKTGFSLTPSIVFEYQPTREGEHAFNFLKGFQGYLQTDAYKGYNVVTQQEDVTSVGCMGHARRKFVDVAKINQNPGKASIAVQIIGKLYDIERFATENNYTPPQRQKLRQEQSKPVLEAFQKWLVDLQPKVPPKNPLGRAIAYTLNHWASLIQYLEDGRLQIDNNSAERMIRPFTIGRKNWLFMGSVEGAKAGCAIYSIIETAKANGLEPYNYLRVLLEKIPITLEKDYHTLLPWNFKQSTG